MLQSRVKEWLNDFRGRLSVSAGPLLQCLISVFLAGSPFPSHPTGRSVFPSPAVRQSSSHVMRRLSLVPDDSAPDVNDAQGVQSRIRVFLPPEASAFTAIVQIAAK